VRRNDLLAVGCRDLSVIEMNGAAIVISRERQAAAWALLAVAGITCLGCSAGDVPVPISGKVTVDGVPLAHAGVVFHPHDGKGRPATAETAEDGTYRLTTFKVGDGALKGEYRVTLVWEEPVHPYLATRDGAPQKEALRQDYLVWKEKHKDQPSPIPPEYTNAGSTPLSQKVPTPGGIANFDVKAQHSK
jgi:hypothetical protein